MARQRIIKPEFWKDEDLGQHTTRDARLLAAAILNHADRRGRLEDRPARLKMEVFPWDGDVTPDSVDRLLADLEAARYIIRYAGPDGRRYIQIRTFARHQHPHPNEQESTIPAPPPDPEPGPAGDTGGEQRKAAAHPEMQLQATEGRGDSPACPSESDTESDSESVQTVARSSGESPPNGAAAVGPVLLDAARCPDCRAQGTLRRQSAGDGWFCGTRLGGCNARFDLGDAAIMRQLSPRVVESIRTRLDRQRAQARASPEPVESEWIRAGIRWREQDGRSEAELIDAFIAWLTTNRRPGETEGQAIGRWRDELGMPIGASPSPMAVEYARRRKQTA